MTRSAKAGDEPGITGMTSPPSSEVVGFMSTSSDSIEILDLTKTNVSAELLQGISLQKTLRSFGRLWRFRPADLNLNQRAQLYRQSKPVAKLDVYLARLAHARQMEIPFPAPVRLETHTSLLDIWHKPLLHLMFCRRL